MGIYMSFLPTSIAPGPPPRRLPADSLNSPLVIYSQRGFFRLLFEITVPTAVYGQLSTFKVIQPINARKLAPSGHPALPSCVLVIPPPLPLRPRRLPFLPPSDARRRGGRKIFAVSHRSCPGFTLDRLKIF